MRGEGCSDGHNMVKQASTNNKNCCHLHTHTHTHTHTVFEHIHDVCTGRCLSPSQL